MRIDTKTMRDITEALTSAIYIAGDAKEDHKNDPEAYQYYRGKEEAYRHALDVVKVIGS